MGAITVSSWVPGDTDTALERWVATEHWSAWMDEVEEVIAVSDDYPAVGSTVRWRSAPAGRGEVTETVIEYAPGAGIASEVADGQLTAVQTVSFSEHDGGVVVGLTLEYRISKRSPFTLILDRFFVRPAMEGSLRSTVERFGGQLSIPRD